MRTRIITIFLVIIFLAGCNGSKEQSASFDIPEGFESIEVIGMAFAWKIEGDNLRGILYSPRDGWVAVGFNPTRMMENADLVMAYVSEGTGFIRDDYGSGITSHESDISLGGKDNLTLVRAEETEKGTVIEFLRPLDSGDETDRAIEPGREYPVVFAYGTKDNFNSIHSKRGKETIKF